MLCQLEVPDAAVLGAWEQATGLFCLNAAPARPIDVDADLTVVNRYELEVLKRRDGLVAVTLGAEGAVLLEDGEEVARAEPPQVDAVDGTAAGDAFTACLLVSLLEGPRPRRGAAPRLRRRGARSLALRRAALAADRGRGRRHTRASDDAVILDCDPGHDDAIALLLALASPEIELVGVTTVHGNQTLEKTTDNALRVLALAGPRGRSRRDGRRPAARARAARCRARPRRERARRAGAAAARLGAGRAARRRLPRRARRAGDGARGRRAADERRAGARPRHPAGTDRADGRRDRGGKHDAGGRVQHLGRPRGGAARLRARVST